MDEKSVWTRSLTTRQARKVARALKAEGYGIATAKLCRDYIINIARYFEPGDADARAKLLDVICGAAGIKPHK